MTHDHVQLARDYLHAVEQGATGDTLRALYDEQVVSFEYPNLLFPQGVQRDLSAVLDGAERGQRVVRAQRYQVHDVLADGERVAMRVTWSAELKVPLGTRQVGERITAEFGVFLTFRAGKVVEHHTYDCFAQL